MTQTRYTQPDFSAMLAECRRNFGAVPRQIGWYHYHSYLSLSDSRWPKGHSLSDFFTHQKSLFVDGDIVWGHIIQANQLLFQPGDSLAPGEVVYCTDPTRTVEYAELKEIAHRLYSLKEMQIKKEPRNPYQGSKTASLNVFSGKGTPATETEEEAIGNYLANQRIRVFGRTVPSSISPDLPCAISSVLFNRRHLPGRPKTFFEWFFKYYVPTGYLSKVFFPLIVRKEQPKIATVLPGRYWAEPLRQWWIGN